MPVGVARSSVPRLAPPVLPEATDEGGEVRKMSRRDIDGSRQVFKAERLDGPARVTPEDFSDPNLLGAGQHGAGYRSRMRRGEPAGRPDTKGARMS